MRGDAEKEPKTAIVEHRFLDEAGDTTFYGKGGQLILGANGVSSTFSIGMVKLNEEVKEVRKRVLELQKQIENDDFLNVLPSVRKKIERGGFHFHATDDPPEVRERFFRFIKSLDCSVEVMVARKVPALYAAKHNGREREFYADVLSHLIKTKLKLDRRLVLNIAERGNTTKNTVLESALQKARSRAGQKWRDDEMCCDIVFNVQNHQNEPLLNIADYLCWPVQRIFERGETRYYDYIREKISLVVDLYDAAKYEGWRNYYDPKKNPLTAANKISPHSA